MNRLTQLSTVAMVTLSLTACLSERQPPRHNFVEGQRRTPALNQMTANPTVPYPTEEMLYPPVQNPPPLPPVTQQGAGLPPQTQATPQADGAQAMQPAQPANAPLEPSPLYYYEQQQQQEAVGVAPLPETPAIPVAEDIAPTASPVAASPAMPSSDMPPQAALEPSPLALMQEKTPDASSESIPNETEALAPAEVEIKEGAADSSVAYPSLRDVPEKQAPVADAFVQAKQNADNFHAEKESLAAPASEQPVGEQPALDVASPAQGEVVHEQTLDEVLAKEVIEDAAKEAQIEEVTPPPAPPSAVDFSQQPLPVNPASAAQEAPVDKPVAAIPVFAEDDSQAPAVDAPAAPLTAAPPPEVVEVETPPLVAAQPRNQRIYTSGGVVELTPPPSMRSRGSELPPSRYYDRRQLQNYRTRTTQ